MSINKRNRAFRTYHKELRKLVQLCGGRYSFRYLHLINTAEQLATQLYAEINNESDLLWDDEEKVYPLCINGDTATEIKAVLSEAGHKELTDVFNRTYSIYRPAVRHMKRKAARA